MKAITIVCSECRYWANPSVYKLEGGFGECTKAQERTTGPYDNLDPKCQFYAWDIRAHEPYLATRPTFGCRVGRR